MICDVTGNDGGSGRPAFEHIDAASLESELEWLRTVAPDPVAGVFGPQSLTWRINREALMFLGAGRALLLQLAHPWVSAAIAEHSTTLADPIARFHGTFSITYAMVFGTLDQAIAAARRLHSRHERVRGVLRDAVGPYGARSPYQANDVSALAWVHATLIETAVIVHDLVLPPLTDGEREEYLAESRRFAALFGIPRRASPSKWGSFIDHSTAMWESSAVSPVARTIGHQLLSAPRRWLPIPDWYRDITAGLLPQRVREAYGIPYGDDHDRNGKRALSRIRTTYGLLPSRLRYVAPYQEAIARLQGQHEPDWLTQRLNRLWIGRPRLEQ